MGFFDFIGTGPGQLSLPEILSAIPAVAGPVLMERGRRVGLPLGIGLTALGGLGQEYAQRQRTQSQHQGVLNLIKSMPGVTPEMQKSFEQAVQQGVDPTGIYTSLLKSQIGGQKATPYEDWRRANPNAPVSDWYKMVASARPAKADKPTPFELWRQQNPQGTIADWEKLTHPAMNIVNERPLGGIQYDASGKPIGILEVDKAGNPVFRPVPPGLPPKVKAPAPLKIPLPATTKTVGGNVYNLIRKPDGTLAYKLAKPSMIGSFGPPAELPGPGLLPEGVVTYTRPDGSVGFATRR